MRRSVSEPLAVLALAVAALFAAGRDAGADDTLLTNAEAPAAVFAGADHFERGELPSTPDLRRRVATRLGEVKPTVWESSYEIATAFSGASRLGRAIVVEEIGKHRPITLVVGVDDDHKVIGVAVMVYREPYGGEVRSRRFLAQYRGKGVSDPLQPSRDIVNITGATLSARAVGRAVKKAIAILEESGESRGKTTMLAPSLTPASTSGPCRVREAHYVMGTILELELDAPNEATGRRWIRQAVAEARRLDAELSSFDSGSALSRLNRSAGEGGRHVPRDLFELLEISRDLAEETGGTFDVTVSPAVELWRRAAIEHRWPAAAEISAARLAVGPQAMRLNTPDVVELASGSSIELGGVGKGFAVDRIVRLLRELGVMSALVNFGESSLAAIGPPADEPAWPVWIRGADGLGPIRLRDTALSTSASFGQSERVAGKRIGHIIDPRSGQPLTSAAQATVLASSGAEAEAWSKALLVDSEAAFRRLETRPEVAAVVLGGGSRQVTENFSARASWSLSRR